MYCAQVIIYLQIEFLYINNISTTEDELMNITCECDKVNLPKIDYIGLGNLIEPSNVVGRKWT